MSEKLKAITELLFPADTEEDANEVNESDGDDNSSESGIADINSDESSESVNSYKMKVHNVKLKRRQSRTN